MTDSIDEVAAVLRRLKHEVRVERLRSGSEQATEVAAALEDVKLNAWINPHQPIAWPEWPKGFGPKAVALAQKVVRRLLRWYINPIVEEQNRFNQSVTQALEALAAENARLRSEVRVHSSEPLSELSS
jgi:hypothetical protein